MIVANAFSPFMPRLLMIASVSFVLTLGIIGGLVTLLS